jgi:hypothetical protein
MRRAGVLLALVLLAATAVSISVAQRWGRRAPARARDGTIIDRRGVDTWNMQTGFRDDTFTFVRIAYRSWGGRGWFDNRWDIDGPDSELNFSFRLQQLTSIKVNPDPIVLTLSDPRLFNYPFIYMVEPGYLEFSPDEVTSLRRYLQNGGFMMVDDFWGDNEWYNFAREMKRVFPDKSWQEVPLSHEIFHCVYDLKERPQVPAIGYAMRGYSYERPDAREVHYRAWYDDEGRMVVFACHNTDLGDGWEREGENERYFREYSEKKAYPMGINIVTYAMTH